VAYQVSLNTLIQRALQRSNLEGASLGSNPFLSPSELADMVNQSIADWYDMVRLTTWGGQFYRSVFALPGGTSPGVSVYPLPGDFLSMISVDVFITPNMVLNARPFQEENRNMFRWYPVGWLYDQPIFYQVWGNNISFIPSPQSVFTVSLNYVPTAPVLAGNAQLDGINGWEEWIVLDVAIKALVKDGQLDIIPALEGMREAQAARIRAGAVARDQGAAEVVHDVTTSFDDWDLF
jgi:hypothetical protein